MSYLATSSILFRRFVFIHLSSLVKLFDSLFFLVGYTLLSVKRLTSLSVVTPIYYVFFTTATIAATVILFQGFQGTEGRDIASVFCGFITIFVGVLLLNTPKMNDTRRGSKLAAGGNVFDATLLHNFDEETLGFTGLSDDDDDDVDLRQ
jgi:hypothetical protein